MGNCENGVSVSFWCLDPILMNNYKFRCIICVWSSDFVVRLSCCCCYFHLIDVFILLFVNIFALTGYSFVNLQFGHNLRSLIKKQPNNKMFANKTQFVLNQPNLCVCVFVVVLIHTGAQFCSLSNAVRNLYCKIARRDWEREEKKETSNAQIVRRMWFMVFI